MAGVPAVSVIHWRCLQGVLSVQGFLQENKNITAVQTIGLLQMALAVSKEAGW